MNKLSKWKGRSGSLTKGGGQNDHFYVPTIIDEENASQSVTDNLDSIQATLLNFNRSYNKKMEALDAAIAKLEAKEGFPVGSVYISVDDIHPRDKLGYGDWKLISEGRCLVGAGDGRIVGTTGGQRDVVLSEWNMPAHSHDVTLSNFSGHRGTSTDGGVRSTSGAGAHSHSLPHYYASGSGSSSGYSSRSEAIALQLKTNGVDDHSHSVDINHSHSVDISHGHTVHEVVIGANAPFNIENPYLVVNIWHRVS